MSAAQQPPDDPKPPDGLKTEAPHPQPPFNDPAIGFELYTFMRQRLETEGNYRRTREWTIFAWFSGLMLAIMGGVIAAQANGRQLQEAHNIGLTVAVGLFAVLGVLRIRHDHKVMVSYGQAGGYLDWQFGFRFDPSRFKSWHIANMGLLGLLGVMAVAVIWLPVLFPLGSAAPPP